MENMGQEGLTEVREGSYWLKILTYLSGRINSAFFTSQCVYIINSLGCCG